VKDRTVSIVIPTLNNAKQLVRCLESLVNQTSHNFEIIIIDGNSTDNTKEVVGFWMHQYQTIHFSYLRDKDRGVYDAMNKGVLAAKGKWIYFLGSDDYFINHSME
jgi:glycosyltransferase involved in cell wall biosynthesis